MLYRDLVEIVETAHRAEPYLAPEVAAMYVFDPLRDAMVDGLIFHLREGGHDADVWHDVLDSDHIEGELS